MSLSLPDSPSGQYCCQRPLNLYEQPDCESLSTQAAPGRHFEVTAISTDRAVQVTQCEDGYSGWLPLSDLTALVPVPHPYQAIAVERDEIVAKIPRIIDYLLQAKAQPNQYLWGGNIGPNYDCSGLVQAAFASEGIWLPRDSYQQAAFCEMQVDGRGQNLSTSTQREHLLQSLLPGDLVFFGSQRVDHVGIYLGEGNYIHSSGKTMGRNGIGIDSLIDWQDPISEKYAQKWWYGSRVLSSFNPALHTIVKTDIQVNVEQLK